mgnify:CR=1 FL=1|tara:strand:+ start:171 stop:503 length:333 start_codon:yes stop_codon:yes gene_type:complete
MMNEKYREPLVIDDSGCYVTVAQMDFFLRQKNGQAHIDSASPVFQKWYRNCCLYNCVFDMIEDDPTCGSMYWDSVSESVAMSFPVNGKICKVLSSLQLHFEEGSDDEEYD